MTSQSRRLILAAILVTTALAFSRAFDSGYVTWDDDRLVLHNLYLGMPFGQAMRGIWSHSYDGDYHPIPFLSYWLEVKAFGFDSVPQHVVNLLLHLLNVSLVYLWLSRLRIARGVTIALALVFALHPVQTESVMWIGERKGLLAASFLLLGLVAFERATASPSRWLRWTVVWTVCFTLSCLCKSIGILLPFVFVVYARWVERKSWQDALRPNVGAGVIAVMFAVLQYKVYTAAVPQGGTAALGVEHWPTLFPMIATAIGHYLVSIFYPLNLSVLYSPFQQFPHRTITFVVGGLYLGVLARSVIRREHAPEVFLGLWSVALLLPTIPRFNFVNDRYLYLPIVGIGGFLSSVVPSSWRSAREGPAWRVVGVCVGIVIAGITFAQSKIWEDSLTLWTATVRHVPQMQLALTSLGVAQMEAGRPTDAEQSFVKATKVAAQESARPYINLAAIYMARHQPMDAQRILLEGLPFAYVPEERFAVKYSIGLVQLQLKQRSAAARTFSELLEEMKASSNAYNLRLEQQVRDMLSAVDR
jgi:hypothetical protein